MNIEIKAELQVRDFLRLHTDTLRRRGSLPIFVAMPLMGICWLATMGSDSVGFVLGMAMIIFPGILLLILYRNSKKQKEQTAVYRHPVLYRLTDEYLYVESSQGSSTVPWSDFFDRMESGHAFYPYVSSLQAYILPKRYFTPEQIAQVHDFFHSRIPSKDKAKRRARILSWIACLLLIGLTAWTALLRMQG